MTRANGNNCQFALIVLTTQETQNEQKSVVQNRSYKNNADKYCTKQMADSFVNNENSQNFIKATF